MKLNSLTDIVKVEVSKAFEEIILEEIDKIVAHAQSRLDTFAEAQRVEARKAAQKMTLELLHKMNSSGLSVEFKI